MNIPVAKPLCDIHNNICYYMKKQNVVLNTKQCHNLEQLINHAENPKEIMSLLETKMVKQTKIETVLRLLCLFSVTQSGLKQEQFDHLRRVFLMCYGYQEVATLCNLQDSGILRVRDKGFDWSDIKEVSYLNTTNPALEI